MNRNFKFSEGEYYHVYNRGVEKRDIFSGDRDKLRFQSLLYLANSDKPVVYRLIQGRTLYGVERGNTLTSIGAYTLMPNHFHILLKETRESGITEFLRKLTTAYTMYFNQVHERVGPLFQGKFKAQHVDRDEYLKYLYAYIHLNPIKLIDPNWREHGINDQGKAKKYLAQYAHSSYPDYIGVSREERAILAPEEFPEYFSSEHTFEDFVNDWQTYKDAE